jgi:hypothetical protein
MNKAEKGSLRVLRSKRTSPENCPIRHADREMVMLGFLKGFLKRSNETAERRRKEDERRTEQATTEIDKDTQ